MSLTLGRQGGIAQPLKKRTVGQTNIAHVYDGANHIWPTSVIHFSDFTSVQLRYIWGSDDGRDLDTKSYYVNSPIDSLNYMAVGWSWYLSQIPYLYWGGDNTQSGAECVMFNIESMIDLEDKMPDIMKMNLCANWFGLLLLFILVILLVSNLDTFGVVMMVEIWILNHIMLILLLIV